MFRGLLLFACVCVVFAPVVRGGLSPISWPIFQQSFKDPYSADGSNVKGALLDIYVRLCHPWNSTLNGVTTYTDDLQSIQIQIPTPSTPVANNPNTGYLVGPAFTDHLIPGTTTRGGVSTAASLKVSWDGFDTLTFSGLTDAAAGLAVVQAPFSGDNDSPNWVNINYDIPDNLFINPFISGTSGATSGVENTPGILPLVLVPLVPPPPGSTKNPAINQNFASLFAAVPKPGITDTETCRGNNIAGDPVFSGFQGQTFQFHGLPDEHFNLVSSPDVQLNSHFVYLSSGKCDYNDTECYTHPGTYMDVLGFSIVDDRIKLVAGTHDAGLRLWFNEQEIIRGSYIKFTNTSAYIKYHQNGHVEVHTEIMNFDVVNSDMFMNVHVALNLPQLLRIGRIRHTITDKTLCKTNSETHDHQLIESTVAKKYPVNTPLHGLIGQTWRNVKVCGRDWMGTVGDYLVSDLFASDYHYNYYRW